MSTPEPVPSVAVAVRLMLVTAPASAVPAFTVGPFGSQKKTKLLSASIDEEFVAMSSIWNVTVYCPSSLQSVISAYTSPSPLLVVTFDVTVPGPLILDREAVVQSTPEPVPSSTDAVWVNVVLS